MFEKTKIKVYPAESTNDTITYGNWSYDIFKGFTLYHTQWNTEGSYQVVGYYQLPVDERSINMRQRINRRNFSLPVSIHVEGGIF